jgi:nitroreductase
MGLAFHGSSGCRSGRRGSICTGRGAGKGNGSLMVPDSRLGMPHVTPRGRISAFLTRVPWLVPRLRPALRIVRDYFNRSLIFHAWNAVSDLRRFRKHSAVLSQGTAIKLGAKIIRQTHIIEKGLALRDPLVTLRLFRPDPLVADMEEYLERWGNQEFLHHAAMALQSYIELCGDPRAMSLRDGLARIQKRMSQHDLPISIAAGSSVVQLRRERVQEAAQIDLSDFMAARHSIRQFGPEEVSDFAIRSAVEMASTGTPSACNRQPVHIYVLSGDEAQLALRLQGGNRGFSDQINKVLVVTADLGHCLNIGERHQGWTDGGMFAMSVIYALHSKGLGTCCLNWAKDRSVDQRAKKMLGLSDAQTIIMLIAVGTLPETVVVARSARKDLEDVLSFGLSQEASRR